LRPADTHTEHVRLDTLEPAVMYRRDTGHLALPSFPTRRSSDLRRGAENASGGTDHGSAGVGFLIGTRVKGQQLGSHPGVTGGLRSEEHTSELQALRHLVCRHPLEKKKFSCDHTLARARRGRVVV